MHHHRQVRCTFHYRYTKLTRDFGQPWCCLSDAVLHHLLSKIRIGTNFERDRECHTTI